MNKSIRLLQYRALHSGLHQDYIHAIRKGCVTYLANPIIRKTINDIKYLKKGKMRVNKWYEVHTKGSVFALYSIDFNHTSQDHYVITKDDKIIYHCFSNVFAPASDAFHVLTEVFHTYAEHSSNWQWISVNEAKSFQFFAGEKLVINTVRVNEIPEQKLETMCWF